MKKIRKTSRTGRKKQRALLLLGPTGSGKTPLGEYLEEHGLGGRRCLHFDFGANLRAAASGALRVLTRKETAFIRHVLETNALLEDAQFYIAEKILRGFLKNKKAGPDDWLILNGLPRHPGQAQAIERIADVWAVLELTCTPAMVMKRIRTNAGGDRAGRADDDPRAIKVKLKIYAERTAPLIVYYAKCRVKIVRIKITARSTPERIARNPVVQGVMAGPKSRRPEAAAT